MPKHADLCAVESCELAENQNAHRRRCWHMREFK